MDSDTVDRGREEIHKVMQEIIEKKEQKTHGLRPASFIVRCSECRRETKKAFTGYNMKKKKFICFDCLQENL